MKVVSENRASTLVISMESVMINHWISGNLLLDKTKVQDMELPPPVRMAQTSMNPQKPTIHPALSSKTDVFICFPCISGHPLNFSRTADFSPTLQPRARLRGSNPLHFWLSKPQNHQANQVTTSCSCLGDILTTCPKMRTKGVPPPVQGSNRKKACNCLLPVVPHKAVAEVSKIGNL